MSPRLCLAVSLAFAGFVSVPATGATIGQIDTFQDLTTNGWFAGGLGPPGQAPPVPPQVVGNGGPAGAGDAFLRITASGVAGPGSRLVAINGAQWAGDYLGAGIGSIEMDLANLGSSDLTIRLLFENPLNAPPTDQALTTFGAVLPAGSGWRHVVFPVLPGQLVALLGDPANALATTTLLRIIHAPAAAAAVPVAGVLGIDNITATAVPEPSALVLLGFGLATLAAKRRGQ